MRDEVNLAGGTAGAAVCMICARVLEFALRNLGLSTKVTPRVVENPSHGVAPARGRAPAASRAGLAALWRTAQHAETFPRQ